MDDKSDIWVDAEASTLGFGGMMKSSRKINSPSQLLSNKSCHDTALGGSDHGIKYSPSQQKSWDKNQRHLDILTNRDSVAKLE